MKQHFRLYLLNSDKDLYAFTSNKDYMLQFELQRDMNKFTIKDISIDKDIISSELMYINRNKMLYQDVLSDGNVDYDIICTPIEGNELDKVTYEICDELEELCIDIINLDISDKYKKVITDLTNNIKGDKSLNVNTFKIFVDLFKNTF